MTKTRTDIYGVLILVIATVCSTALLIWMIYEWTSPQGNIGQLQRILFSTISGLVTPFLWTAEIPKLKSVTIDDKNITLKNLLTRTTKEISLSDLDGFKTTNQWAKGGPVYEIILFAKGRRLHDISSNYIKNYDEIRSALGKRLVSMGTEKFNYFKYLKERLTN